MLTESCANDPSDSSPHDAVPTTVRHVALTGPLPNFIRTTRRLLLAGLLSLTSVVAVAPAASPAAAAALPSGSSTYVAVTPQRMADTRPSQGSYGYTMVNASTMRIAVTGREGVPEDAIAAVVNVTIIGSGAKGYITVFPSGQALPTTSNVNADAPGRTVANMAHVKLGTNGSIDLFRSGSMNVAVDLVGVYVPVTAAVSSGRLQTLAAGAQRVSDSRPSNALGANTTRTIDLAPAGLPTGASAALVNITAVTAFPGFWTAFPSGTSRPNVSTLNIDTVGQTRAAQAIVPLNGVRTISVYASGGGHLLVDLVGWYTGDGAAAMTDGLFLPAAPMRMLDTRALRTLAPWGGSTYEFQVGAPVANAAAAVMNLTGTQPWDKGYVTAYPAGLGRPNSSNLNVTGWNQTIANHAITRVTTRGAALFTDAGLHMIADVAGWFLGTPSAPVLAAPSNPNYTPNLALRVNASKAYVNTAVKASSSSYLDYWADRGYAATWSDLANVATPGNVMLFGHRTTGSAPFRYINLLNVGDSFSILGSDGRTYHYRVVDERVTLPSYSTIAGLAAAHGPMTAQLVACSKLDGSATSTKYRLVITGRLYAVT